MIELENIKTGNIFSVTKNTSMLADNAIDVFIEIKDCSVKQCTNGAIELLNFPDLRKALKLTITESNTTDYYVYSCRTIYCYGDEQDMLLGLPVLKEPASISNQEINTVETTVIEILTQKGFIGS